MAALRRPPEEDWEKGGDLLFERPKGAKYKLFPGLVSMRLRRGDACVMGKPTPACLACALRPHTPRMSLGGPAHTRAHPHRGGVGEGRPEWSHEATDWPLRPQKTGFPDSEYLVRCQGEGLVIPDPHGAVLANASPCGSLCPIVIIDEGVHTGANRDSPIQLRMNWLSIVEHFLGQ